MPDHTRAEEKWRTAVMRGLKVTQLQVPTRSISFPYDWRVPRRTFRCETLFLYWSRLCPQPGWGGCYWSSQDCFHNAIGTVRVYQDALWTVECTRYVPASEQIVFRDDLLQTLIVYLEDIIIFSKPIYEHLAHLEAVFGKLKTAWLENWTQEVPVLLSKSYLAWTYSDRGRCDDRPHQDRGCCSTKLDLPQVDSLIFLVMARCMGTIKIWKGQKTPEVNQIYLLIFLVMARCVGTIKIWKGQKPQSKPSCEGLCESLELS